MLVPGSGEPNFDSYVADPFQNRKARQEQEVHQLLDKLQPDMIVLDPTTIGQVSFVHCQATASTSCILLLLQFADNFATLCGTEKLFSPSLFLVAVMHQVATAHAGYL